VRRTICTQPEPSPTAEATRLTLPERTSLTAKTRWRFVSKRKGARAAVGDEMIPVPNSYRLAAITSIPLEVGARIAGIDPAKFQTIAESAKRESLARIE